jgi:hypothetical protein
MTFLGRPLSNRTMHSTAPLGLALGLAATIGFFSGCGSTPAKTPTALTATQNAPVHTFDSTDVDALLEKAWTAHQVTPAPPANDATFLRRVYLDLVGTIPPPEKVTAFLADMSADKRSKLVDELLASPAYAEHWADYWEDELMGRSQAQDIDRLTLRLWLRDQFQKNVAWDKVVASLLTASGQNTVGGERPKTLKDAANALAKSAEPINGAVNYVLKYRDTPQDWAGSASKTFLGVQIQCAQCHDHKTEKWKKDDFQKFAACFMRAQTLPLDGAMAKGLRRALVRDIDRPLPRFMRDPELAAIGRATPTALDGTAMQGNPREAITKWITESPTFAREAVNRMWAHFLGRGFVDPFDDLRPSNPTDAPEVESVLARDFAQHHYDVKRLIRIIALTRAYGLSTDKSPPLLWSRFRAQQLGPNELLDAIVDATQVDEALRRLGRFNVEELLERVRTLYGFVFDVDEEFDKPSYEGNITQALIGLNGRLIAGGSTAIPGTAVARIARSDMTDEEKVVALYLRTLSRKPTREETDDWVKYLSNPPPLSNAQAPDSPTGKRVQQGPMRKAPIIDRVPETREARIAAVEDLMWTLLNSSEFTLNH